jgi:DNA processing protein
MPASTLSVRNARILLSHLTEPGDEYAGKLLELVTVPELIEMIVRDTIAIPSPAHAAFIQRVRPRYHENVVRDILTACEVKDITIITREDPQWPVSFEDLGRTAPHVLYVKGQLDWPKAHNVAIVGARAATSYGEHVTMELAADLARDHTIVSGAAYGIDGAAHRATLAAGGTTIAFLAGGVDRPYPAGHADLISRITERGAVVSEVPPGSSPTKWRFLMRNRLIAAASEASIVVEAGFRSGSLNEAAHAYGLGRAVGAVPGPITSAASAGCHHLIAEAHASLITSADDVRHLTGATTKEVSMV